MGLTFDNFFIAVGTTFGLILSVNVSSNLVTADGITVGPESCFCNISSIGYY